MAEKTQQIEIIKEQGTELEKAIAKIKIDSEESLGAASDEVKRVKQFQKMVEAEKEKYVAPAKEIIASAKAQYDPYIDLAKKMESALKEQAAVYIMDRNKKIEAKQAAIAKKAEEGKISTDTAIKKLEKLPEATKSVATESSGLSVRMIKEVVIVDESKIPDEYWIVDVKKVSKVVLAGLIVPGTKIEEKPSVASR